MSANKKRVAFLVLFLLAMIACWYARGFYDQFVEFGEIKGGYGYLYTCIDSIAFFFDHKGHLPLSVQEALHYCWPNSRNLEWVSEMNIRYYPLSSEEGTYSYCLVIDFGRSPRMATAVAVVHYVKNESGQFIRLDEIHAGGEDYTR